MKRNRSAVLRAVNAAKPAILARLDFDRKGLADDYSEALREGYEEDVDHYADFGAYLEDRCEDYVDFALTVYLIHLIPQVTKVTEEELDAVEGLDEILQPFRDYFKGKIEKTE